MLYKLIHIYSRLFWIIAIVAANASRGFGSSPVVLTDEKDIYNLNLEFLDVYVDKTEKFTIKDVSTPEFASNFTFYNDFLVINRNEGRSVWWLRFKVINQSKKKKWTYVVNDQKIDKLEVYYPSPTAENEFNKYVTTGDALPFATREIKHKYYVMNAPESGEVYVRVELTENIVLLSRIVSVGKVIQNSIDEYIGLGLFYGIILFVIIYNLLLYFSLRDPTYIYYIAYVFATALFTSWDNGIGFQYLWSEYPELNNTAMFHFSIFLITASCLLYVRSFLQAKKYYPDLNKLIFLFIVIRILVYGIGLQFIPALLKTIYVDLLLLGPIYLFTLRAWWRGNRSARFLVLGLTFVILGFSLSFFRLSVGVRNFIESYVFFDASFWTLFSLQVGVVLEVIILSFALSDRLKRLRKERELAQEQIIAQLHINQGLKDKVNKELEAKVSERTFELGEANLKLRDHMAEIERLNSLLKKDNEKLTEDVKDISKARVMLKGVDFDEFIKIYPDEESCFNYLADLKWKNGYTCRRCGNAKYSKGKLSFSRRCSKCNYDESVTAFTIFHHLKFPIVKAFYMTFLISANNNITGHKLSDLVTLRKPTCVVFKKKILDVIKLKKRNTDYKEGWANLILMPHVAETNRDS